MDFFEDLLGSNGDLTQILSQIDEKYTKEGYIELDKKYVSNVSTTNSRMISKANSSASSNVNSKVNSRVISRIASTDNVLFKGDDKNQTNVTESKMESNTIDRDKEYQDGMTRSIKHLKHIEAHDGTLVKKIARDQKKYNDENNLMRPETVNAILKSIVDVKNDYMSPPICTTITLSGKITPDISFDESEFIKRIKTNDVIHKIKCNYGEVRSPNYIEDVKIRKSKRGRPKKMKEPASRKPCGDGSSFNSQITMYVMKIIKAESEMSDSDSDVDNIYGTDTESVDTANSFNDANDSEPDVSMSKKEISNSELYETDDAVEFNSADNVVVDNVVVDNAVGNNVSNVIKSKDNIAQSDTESVYSYQESNVSKVSNVSGVSTYSTSTNGDSSKYYYKFKIFRKGTIQLPGAKPETIIDIIQKTSEIVKLLNATLYDGKPVCRVDNLKPCMKNYKFKIIMQDDEKVDLYELKKLLIHVKNSDDGLYKGTDDVLRESKTEFVYTKSSVEYADAVDTVNTVNTVDAVNTVTTPYIQHINNPIACYNNDDYLQTPNLWLMHCDNTGNIKFPSHPKIYEIGYSRKETCLCISFCTPIINNHLKKTKIKIFAGGKVNIIGAVHETITCEIYMFLQSVIERFYEWIVYSADVDADMSVVRMQLFNNVSSKYFTQEF